MAVTGKKLSELTDKVETIQGTERIYVSDGTNVPKYIETGQLAKASDIPDVSGFATKEELGNIDAILDNINGEVIS